MAAHEQVYASIASGFQKIIKNHHPTNSIAHVRELFDNVNGEIPTPTAHNWAMTCLQAAFCEENLTPTLSQFAIQCAEHGYIRFPFVLQWQRSGNVDKTQLDGHSHWDIFRHPNQPTYFEQRLPDALQALHHTGYAVLDGLLGPTHAELINKDVLEYHSQHQQTYSAGELDETKRSDTRFRDDHITWLDSGLSHLRSDNENFTNYINLAAGCQVLQSSIPMALKYMSNPPTLYDEYDSVSNVMLSCYSPNSRGFAQHTDNSGPTDSRRISLIYYTNPNWQTDWAGELILKDKNNQTHELQPLQDRLIMFSSQTCLHEVKSSAEHAPNRHALSFWITGQ